MKTYRAASLWFHWSDAIYPDKGIEKQMEIKAAKCRQAGIDLAIIFGFHFRWDYIYIWDRVHELFNFTCEAFHKQGIQVFDHHSANLTHRPRNLEDKWDIYYHNRHHVPFYPSRETAAELAFNGVKLNDYRMIDVVSGKPCYLPGYTAEIFCMNNEHFRAGYRAYLKKLFAGTGVDGLMCDDIFYYPGWHGCACAFCRKKFSDKYGHDLPAANDKAFWGNYTNSAFRDWVHMRYFDSADFLAMVRDEIGKDKPLLSCCSSSIAKWVDSCALNAGVLSRASNHIMLEMCGEIVGLGDGFYNRLPNIMYNQGLSLTKDMSSFGLGYAFYPDPAFFVWALDKLTGASTWVSTLKGRLGIPEEDLGNLPDEWDIVAQGFNFEKKYSTIFAAAPDNKIAVYFSFATKIAYGDSEEDYAALFSLLVQELFKNNIGFDVVDCIPGPVRYPALIINDAACLSPETRQQLNAYMQNGGNVIACGALGLYDDRGNNVPKQFMEQFGLKIARPEPERNVDLGKFFEPGQWPAKRNIAEISMLDGRDKFAGNGWLEAKCGQGHYFWMPRRCADSDAARKLMDKAASVVGKDIAIHVPAGWHYRFFRKGNKRYIHFLSGNIIPVMDKIYFNKTNKKPIIRSLKYKTPAGPAEIISPAKGIKIYSPDLARPQTIKAQSGRIRIPLNKIKRYFIAELIYK